MAKFKIIIASRVDQQLLSHVELLAKESIDAARNLRAEYAKVLDQLEENPYQFPLETDPVLHGKYAIAPDSSSLSPNNLRKCGIMSV